MLTKDQIERYYKTQSGSSTPLSPIEFAKQNTSGVNTNEITTIGSTDPVISSKDNAQQYNEDSSLLDNLTATDETGSDKTEDTKSDPTPFATGEKTKDSTTGEVTTETTGDPVLDKMNKWEEEQNAKFETEAIERKEEYAQLFQTSLSAIDAQTNSTIEKINLSYDKRIKEQNKINQLNIDRVKAYGLGGGGIYTPVMFGDAITNRETEASDKISELENNRNQLISDAKSARDAGESKLLREKLEDLDAVEKDLRSQLQDVEKEGEAQYKLLREFRKEEEQKHQDQLDKMLKSLQGLAPSYSEEYEKMTDEEKDQFIDKLSKKTGLDYATIYSTMESATAGILEQDLKNQKAEADIDATEALTKSRKASAFKSYADAGVKNKERQDAVKKEEEMSGKVPDSFVDDKDFFAKRSKFVKEFGIDGGKYWDSVYPEDNVGDRVYPIGDGEDSGGMKSRAEKAGYDYEALSKQYTDEEIDTALKAKGL